MGEPQTPDQTGAIRRDGNPRRRVVKRLESADLNAATDNFPSREEKAYYFAHVIETAACWPRVLAGRMEQDRYHERTKRMMGAILGAVPA